MLIFQITDQGTGIPVDDQKKLFSMLSSQNMDSMSSVTLNNGEHVGMGLLLQKQLIEKFGGKFDFITEFNTGTTYVFSFPVETISYQDKLDLDNQLTRTDSPKFGFGAPGEEKDLIFNLVDKPHQSS